MICIFIAHFAINKYHYADGSGGKGNPAGISELFAEK
jgi:hypothetical protein